MLSLIFWSQYFSSVDVNFSKLLSVVNIWPSTETMRLQKTALPVVSPELSIWEFTVKIALAFRTNSVLNASVSTRWIKLKVNWNWKEGEAKRIIPGNNPQLRSTGKGFTLGGRGIIIFEAPSSLIWLQRHLELLFSVLCIIHVFRSCCVS